MIGHMLFRLARGIELSAIGYLARVVIRQRDALADLTRRLEQANARIRELDAGNGIYPDKPYRDGWLCTDCGDQGESYAVLDPVWAKAMPLYKKVKAELEDLHGVGRPSLVSLCLACLAKRLERPLAIEDFSDAPVNEPIRLGWRMRQGRVDDMERELEDVDAEACADLMAINSLTHRLTLSESTRRAQGGRILRLIAECAAMREVVVCAQGWCKGNGSRPWLGSREWLLWDAVERYEKRDATFSKTVEDK